MKKSYLKKIVAVFALVAMLASASSVFAATNDSFITPWNTTYDFNVSNISEKINYNPTVVSDGTALWNEWPSTYLNLYPYNNSIFLARDSYVDSETSQTVYDGVTGMAGDNYLYINPNGRTATPGGVYFNKVTDGNLSGVNGGLCNSKIIYEFDMRISDISKADYNKKGKVSLYAYDTVNSKRVEAVRIPLNTNGTSYYFAADTSSSIGKLESSMGALQAGAWQHIKIEVDVINDTVTVTQTGTSNTGAATNASKSYLLAAANKAYPMTTCIQIEAPYWGITSVDNLSVTKETFLIDENSTVIDESGESNITATVKVANDVYADTASNFGAEVELTSPVAILAIYDKDNMLVSVNTNTTEFAGKITVDDEYAFVGGHLWDQTKFDGASSSASTTAKKAFFGSPLAYQNIELSCAKPSGEYTAKVYVWKSMDKMIPYTSVYPAE